MRSSLTASALAIATTALGCVDQPDDTDLSQVELASTVQYQYSLAGFTARVHVNGAYDLPVVIVEGFDPNDEYRPEAYWNEYANYRGEMRPPHLTTAFRDMLAARGYDVWIVSADASIAIDSISTNAWRYASYVHGFILNWNGSHTPYVLAGISAGGLVTRGVLGTYLTAAQRQADVRAYISFEAPHEGAYIPRSLMMYMLDHEVCNRSQFSSAGFTDPLTCHNRYVSRGLATSLASDLLRIRMYPTAGGGYWRDGHYYTWPSFWSDCKDLGGCTLMNDGEWYKYGDNSGGWQHGNFAWYIKSATWWNYLGWFTDIPRYAISNGGLFNSTSQKHTSPQHLLKNDVNNAGDHHLYTDDWDRDCTPYYGTTSSQCAGLLQVRGSKDGFMDRLHEVGDGGFFDWNLQKKSNFTFVSHDSAFGVNSGLSWDGRLLGQCNGNAGHDAITAANREYMIDVLNLTFHGFVELTDPRGNATPRDCTCGDGWCGAAEDSYSCPGDCGPAGGTCAGACGGSASSCWCDSYCETAGDCCPDYGFYCGGGIQPY